MRKQYGNIFGGFPEIRNDGNRSVGQIWKYGAALCDLNRQVVDFACFKSVQRFDQMEK